MFNKSNLVILLSAIIAITSCSKYPCARSTGLRLAFVSFAKAETDTIMLTQYVKGSQFATAMDSMLIDTTVVRFINRNDTLFPSALLVRTLLISEYDYRIYLPAVNKTYNITGITEDQLFMKKGFLSGTKETCGNRISSYAIDGQTVLTPDFYEVAYFKK